MAAVAGFGLLGFIEKYLIGFGLGTAAGPSLSPYVQDLANAAWGLVQNRPLPPALYAEIEAKSIGGLDWAGEARKWGLDGPRFDALVQATRQYPGLAQALELWRRGEIAEGDFRGWLHYHGFSDAVVTQVEQLKQDRLAPADVANAVQQGFVDDAGLLPGDVPGPPFDPPVIDVTAIRTLDEFAANGINFDRAQVLAELSGLPPGPVELAQMVMRGEITSDTFMHGIREGHTKTKWGSALLYYLTHPILSAVEYATLHLKGWIDTPTMNAGGALSGYSPEQMNLLYLARGRPAAPGQMATAIARGIDGPDGRPMDQAQFQKGIQESDIRPEWGPMLYGIRYAYPPLFQINRLVQANAIDANTAIEWAKKDRYAPEVVSALGKYWGATATPTVADPHIGKAQVQLWTTTHRSYIADEIDDAAATSALGAAGVTAGAERTVLTLWQHERELIRKQLTPAQIKKAYDKAAVNAATGARWTLNDAIAALVDRGYSVTDAQSYLNIPSGR